MELEFCDFRAFANHAAKPSQQLQILAQYSTQAQRMAHHRGGPCAESVSCTFCAGESLYAIKATSGKSTGTFKATLM